MLCSDLTLPTPEENLACDEALLDMCEGGFQEPILRLWAPNQNFVVVGYANQVALEVDVDACSRRAIPVLRRCTGGGTVLQGPGCLNYSLVLRIGSDPHLSGIAGTNHYVMSRHQAAIQQLLGTSVQLEGHTDLAIAGRKFCGNAQRRRREWLIFHGCFLVDCDISLMEEVLRMPSMRPDYRKDRKHTQFVTNIPVSMTALKDALSAAWGAQGQLATLPSLSIQQLVQEKYSRPEWTTRF